MKSHFACSGEQKLPRGLKTEDKLETPNDTNEENFRSVARTSYDPSISSLFPFPDMLGWNNILSDNYEPHTETHNQSHQSYYLNPLIQLANGPLRTNQSQFHRAFHHQTTSTKIINPNYGTSQASSGNFWLADFHARHGRREEGILRSDTSTDLSCDQTNAEENPIASKGQLRETETRADHQNSSPWARINAVNSSSQPGEEACCKHRIRWTEELHEQFVDAVNILGGATKATPKGILNIMKTPGVTIFHIKSHLQKYRTAKGIPNLLEGRSRRSNCDGMPLSSPKGNGGLQISEALRLQMDVQKSLHEQLEFQKNLQMKIEEHVNYLQQVFDQQKGSNSFFQNNDSDKVINPFNEECSSTRVQNVQGEIFINKHKP